MGFSKADFEMAVGKSSELPQSDLPEVVFSGRSNVGKSSLINKLTNRKSLARVSATPGKTGTINFYNLAEFRLVDLPGYGYAKVSKLEKQRWAELVEGYFAQERKFCLIVQIIDLRHPPTKDDMNMLEFLKNSGNKYIIVLTKKDKLRPMQLKSRLESLNEELKDFGDVKLFPFSALNGEGTEKIREYIINAI